MEVRKILQNFLFFWGGGGGVFRNKLFFTRKSFNIVGRAEIRIKGEESASWGLAKQENIWFWKKKKKYQTWHATYSPCYELYRYFSCY